MPLGSIDCTSCWRAATREAGRTRCRGEGDKDRPPLPSCPARPPRSVTKPRLLVPTSDQSKDGPALSSSSWCRGRPDRPRQARGAPQEGCSLASSLGAGHPQHRPPGQGRTVASSARPSHPTHQGAPPASESCTTSLSPSLARGRPQEGHRLPARWQQSTAPDCTSPAASPRHRPPRPLSPILFTLQLSPARKAGSITTGAPILSTPCPEGARPMQPVGAPPAHPQQGGRRGCTRPGPPSHRNGRTEPRMARCCQCGPGNQLIDLRGAQYHPTPRKRSAPPLSPSSAPTVQPRGRHAG